jgi:translation initiation factor IF-1
VVNFVRLLIGDRVRLELSPVDPGRGGRAAAVGVSQLN